MPQSKKRDSWMDYHFLANLLTGLSLASGFISLVFSLENHFTPASWAIIFAVVFDGLDGQVARKDPHYSLFGKEFDSLVDVVSFGVAPSILGYIFVYQDFHFWATLALFVYLACSIFRLAKYNITPKEELASYFIGLPTTISGGFLASFILIYRRYAQLPPPRIFLVLVLCLAMLMVCRLKYPNLDCLKQNIQHLRAAFFFVLLVVLLIAFFPEQVIFGLFLLYLLFSPFVVKLSKF